jgi:single-strand DNA-binding protein
MFDTTIVIVGNALTAPEWRRTTNTQTLVANFRVASTARRFDKDRNAWVDGESLRVRVNCWRKLAENVTASVTVGDPVVVVGRLYTRDWTDSENNPRISYEMDAVAVGHDLARGKTKLFRNRSSAVTGLDGPEADAVVRGESAEPVPGAEAPIGYGEGMPDDVEPPIFVESPASGDPLTVLAGGGFEPFDTTAGGAEPEPAPEPPAEPESPAEPDGLEIEVEALTEPATPRRPRRSTRRQPVPA